MFTYIKSKLSKKYSILDLAYYFHVGIGIIIVIVIIVDKLRG